MPSRPPAPRPSLPELQLPTLLVGRVIAHLRERGHDPAALITLLDHADARSEAALRSLLSAQAPRLRARLSRIEGREEYAVKLYCDHARLRAVLAQRGIRPEQVKYVIPTHVHLDHAGGVGGLLMVVDGNGKPPS